MSTLDDLERLSTDSDDEEYIPEGAVNSKQLAKDQERE